MTYSSEEELSACETLFREAGVSRPAQVVPALEDPRQSIRDAARCLVEHFGLKRAAPILLRQFVSGEERERGELLAHGSLGSTLWLLKSARVRSQMARWMTSHPDPTVRLDAVLTMVHDRHPSLAPAFLQVIQNAAEEAGTRHSAMEGLGQTLTRNHSMPRRKLEQKERHRDRRSTFWRYYTGHLLPYLHHPDPDFRWEAAWALALAGCRKALPVMRERAAEAPGAETMAEMIEMLERHQ